MPSDAVRESSPDPLTLFSECGKGLLQALSVIAAQCHLSRGERQLLSQIQLLLTLEMRWLPLWGSWRAVARLRG